jgi:hypothetical protein
MKTYAIAVIVALAFGAAAACTGQEAERPVEARSLGATTQAASPAPLAAEQELPPTPLAAEVATRDLGTVGITDGLVQIAFRVSNRADEPVQLAAAYTSCMCTEATLEFEDGTTAGPFGMPGHELPITLDRTLAAGEAFDVRATFDPMAHGPDAVGPMKRAIALHSGNGSMLQLDFTVNVVKQVTGSP